MWRSLHDAWWRLATQSHPRSFWDALASSVLSSGSVAYRTVVALRNLAYDTGWAPDVRLPCRVVSVGNLTVGGTGKTACVELIAKKLMAHGRRVAVLSRGYGGSPPHQRFWWGGERRPYWLRFDDGQLVVNGSVPVDEDGLADEPQLLARRLAGVPILVGARRDRTGRVACAQFSADTVVLDDGFQHRRVQRDCDIVLVHARMPFGGWALLPRGPMREPLTSLKRADVVIMTKADEALETLGALGERLRMLNPPAAFVGAVHEPASLMDGVTGTLHEPKRLNGLRVGLLSSIGDPEGFEATVRRLHATILWHRAFPDHYRYRATDWAAILQQIKECEPDAVVTTEKDWVRLRPWALDPGLRTTPLWILTVRMHILSGEEALDDRLASLYAR